MIKCEVIEEFAFARFNELKDVKRKGKESAGKLFVGDTFICDKDIAKYLNGNNPLNKVVIKVIEVEPVKEVPKVKETKEIEPDVVIETKPKKKKTAKK